ncbi:MAG: 1-acyl-sn-glycerol-3-phosphate acyltransferase [Acidobacteriaceae bacterium]|jgi:1-acyl-sn-glycerol-3-phosphate acyltransferase|nr:1-acyl-sn-glycerol-3-phosphate acyltransferase [Acidobacteriaceae bacterium]
MTPDSLLAAPLPCTPEPLLDAITTFLKHHHLPADTVREALRAEITAAGPQALATLRDRLASAGSEWGYFPADPVARQVHRLLAARLLPHLMRLEGAERLRGLDTARMVIVSNHLSYSDANIVEVLLHRANADAIAERLTVVAGPKVYSNITRRFSSLCFGTIKTPQSSGVSSGEAVMNAREVASAARRTIVVAQERLRAGDALLVFAEGTRSRTGGMQTLLAGVTRYFEEPGTIVLPVGIAGSESLFPIGEQRLTPSEIVMAIGRPINADELRAASGGDRRVMMDEIGRAIAAVLPQDYRGEYAT